MKREEGVLRDWNDERGFGFITRPGGAGDLFVHATAFRQSYTRPRVGDRLSYDIGLGKQGKLAARDVDIAGANPRPRAVFRRGEPEPEFARDSNRVWAAAVLLVLLFAVIILNRAPLWFALPYLISGLVTFGLYSWDKRAAELNQWRLSERQLHTFDLCFGIIGGVLAQHILRHKISKPDFAAVTFSIVALYAVFLAALALGLPDFSAFFAMVERLIV